MSEDRYLKLKAAYDSLRLCHDETSRKYVQAEAQIVQLEKVAKSHITKAADVIDAQAAKIDAMCDEWQAQIRGRTDISEEERAKLCGLVEPFRPERVGKAAVG